MTAETDGPLDEHGKLRPCSPVPVSVPVELSLEERLALVEDDLTDLSRLFVRLEAAVLRNYRERSNVRQGPVAGVPESPFPNESPAERVNSTPKPNAPAPNADGTPNADWLYTVTALVQNNRISSAFDALREALQADPEYAWSWHCNIAMAFYDVGGGDHAMANRAASLFMLRTFGVTTVEPGSTKP